MSRFAGALDRAMEGLVVPSFTRVGYSVRRRTEGWAALDDYDLTGRTVAITGPTSGLGKAATHALARMGADLVLVGRSPDKLGGLAAELANAAGSIRTVCADLGSLDQTRAAADQILGPGRPLDVLIHNAGSLFNDRRVSEDGIELTVAVHVVAPFLLTGLVLESLRAAEAGRVLTMSSGGMYTAPLSVAGLEMDEDYTGTAQYARAKRAQVTLNEMWALRPEAAGTRFHALHPGWANTPGIAASLPTFRKVVGPLLRTPEQGADTLVWLAADDGRPLEENGGFWHDRQMRPIHRTGRTRGSDTPERRRALWQAVAGRAGLALTD